MLLKLAFVVSQRLLPSRAFLCGIAVEDLGSGLGHFFDGDGGQAAAILDYAGFELASVAGGLVVDNLVMGASGEPDTGQSTG